MSLYLKTSSGTPGFYLVLAGKHDRVKALKPSLEWCPRSDGN